MVFYSQRRNGQALRMEFERGDFLLAYQGEPGTDAAKCVSGTSGEAAFRQSGQPDQRQQFPET